VLAALLIAGVAPRPILFLLWALYLSLTVAGQSFLSFQWDALLLEAGLLAALWAPAGWLPRHGQRAPSRAVRLLLVFLLFKLMFLSGITKLLSGDPTWRSATALDFYFETQPLPPWTAWYAHHLPHGVHSAATLVMFAVELVAPWFLFAPAHRRALRIAACAALVFLQVGIAATGNYGFFNLLSIVLCVPVLDDASLRRIVPLRLEAGAPESSRRRKVMAITVPVLLLLSGVSLVREIANTLPPAPGAAFVAGFADRLLSWAEPFRSINGYGLFRVMTTVRPEFIIEGSRDGVHWVEYEFRYKPGPVDRRPRFVAPYHPRLDWQMWFAALDPISNYDWLRSLAEHLRAGTPEVLELLGRNPFSGEPPRFIRIVTYKYRFSTGDERRRTGAWWVREVVGSAPRAARLPGGRFIIVKNEHARLSS
jgi:hypothetical protein